MKRDIQDCHRYIRNHRNRVTILFFIRVLPLVLQGKVELEMSVLRAEDADDEPAGKGRDPPQSLPPPKFVFSRALVLVESKKHERKIRVTSFYEEN